MCWSQTPSHRDCVGIESASGDVFQVVTMTTTPVKEVHLSACLVTWTGPSGGGACPKQFPYRRFACLFLSNEAHQIVPDQSGT